MKLSLLLAVVGLQCLGAESAQDLLRRRCQVCHNDQGKAGGLSLTSVENMRQGGKRGVALVAGKPEDSLLYRVVSGGAPQMPLQGAPLSREEVESIRKWIADGAPWLDPRQWWSLQPLRDSVEGSIDSFIREKLREKGLRASPETDRRTLIRRLTYDLHGLPPTPEAVDAFVADSSAGAYEKLVDRLLASPHYGERWGRHWLDVAHYGESHGYDKDKPRRNAWPYRDWVIKAFNDDMPYKKFVEQQLAGDVLYADDPSAVAALGFIAAGPWDLVGQAELREDTTDKNLTRLLDRDDMVTVTMSSMVSMTAHCARCHNHKFDPIPQEDYYRLQAVFAGVDRAERPLDSDREVYLKRKALLEERRRIVLQQRPLDDAVGAVTTSEIVALDKQVAAWKQVSATDPAKRPASVNAKIAEAAVARRALVRASTPAVVLADLERVRGQLDDVDERLKLLPKPQMVYAAATYFEPSGTFRFAAEPRLVHVLNRGSVESPGKLVNPGALFVVRGVPFDSRVDRRAALAHWVTDPGNMLTWRSIVNRVWHYHFGAGIVDTPNDFGRMGSQPTHPELLDWLAVTFRDSGGSFKKLHKMIVMSAAYRQASAQEAAQAKIDGENRYLWRANRQRLDAESLRDTMLAASGKLDVKMGGPSAEQFFFKDDHSPVYDYGRFDPDDPANYRRSVYRFVVRSVPDPLMERFDCPDVSMVTAKRTTTITAIQALALMNNPFVLKQAEHLASRLNGLTPLEQVRGAMRLTVQRRPTEREEITLTAYLSRAGLPALCRVLLNTNEFLFVD